jgi:hypothetical protein
MCDGERGEGVPVDSIVFVDPDGPVELEDAILMGLGEAVYRAKRAFGSNRVKIESTEGQFEIEAPDEEPGADFDVRLDGLINSSNMVAKKAKVPYSCIAGLLLVLDGWSWNRNIFRAPIWMHDHREIPIEEAKKLKGLEWLTGSSLEIKSELKEGTVKFGE